MESYDPNGHGTHVIQVTFQQWNYKAIHIAEVGGNCFGFNVMEAAFDVIYDNLPKDVTSGEEIAELVLYDDNGDELLVLDDMGDEQEWLKDMAVKVEFLERYTK